MAVRLHDFSGHTFVQRVMKRKTVFYMYTRILADEDTASRFMVDLEVWKFSTNASLKCPGVKVYSADMK